MIARNETVKQFHLFHCSAFTLDLTSYSTLSLWFRDFFH